MRERLDPYPTHGLTGKRYQGTYNRLYAHQNGKRAICKHKTKLELDHCHATGVIRGLLCRSCNNTIKFYEMWISREKQQELAWIADKARYEAEAKALEEIIAHVPIRS